MKTKRLALAVGSFAVVALIAGQPLNDPKDKKSPPKDFKELVGEYQRLDSDAVTDREHISSLSRDLSWLSNNLFRPGMILPFYGPLQEAAALEKEGWVVCDGRSIKDPLAAQRFKGKTTPPLQDRFLKGSTESGQTSGSAKVTTSDDGTHGHLPPAKWYPRSFQAEGNRAIYAGIDSGGGDFKKEGVKTQDAGAHHHSIAMDPPAYSVIYIMYVREVTARK